MVFFTPYKACGKKQFICPKCLFFFEGSDEFTKKKLEALAQSIAEEKVAEAGNEDRLKLHVAAVLVSNFTNHLYALAQEYCKKEGLDFKQLLPLIEETALRIKDISPKQAQTGPAIRHDKETIEKHLELLNDYPGLKKIYLLLTESIQQVK